MQLADRKMMLVSHFPHSSFLEFQPILHTFSFLSFYFNAFKYLKDFCSLQVSLAF